MSAPEPPQQLPDNIDAPNASETDDLPGPLPMLPASLTGSCHCKHITYTVDVELPLCPRLPLASRCNCRVCLKTGFTNFQLPNGRESFHLLTPSSLVDDGIIDYANISKLDDREVHRYFCGKCGVTVCAGGHYRIKAPPAGGETEAEGERDEKLAEVERGGVGERDKPSQPSAPGPAPDSNPEVAVESPRPSSPHQDGEGPQEGKLVEFFSINVVTLDQPQEGLDLSVFRIEYWDGRNDNWMAGKKDSPWPGGIV